MTTPSTTARFSTYLAGSPLRHGSFRLFYAGSVGTALGYTMQASMAAWLMATLTPSALMVALVQSASTVPFLLFGLVAGSLADIMNRRKLIVITQLIMLLSAAVLGAVTVSGVVGPGSLLLLTFLCGSGFTFYLPAQQASINDLVTRADLSRAVALGAVAFNVARAIGPAIAGAIAAWLGSGSALLASSLFFLLMIIGVRSLKSVEKTLPGVPETLFVGVQSGLRFARHSPAMRALVILNVSFSVCASALWALIPLVARDQLSMGPGGYGLLYGTFGAGAVSCALMIPGQLQKRSLNTVVRGSVVLWMIATLLIAATTMTVVALVGAFFAGAAWVGVLASLSAGTQSTAPAWVRARAVSINLMAVQSGLAIGSLLWGMLAGVYDVRVTLAVSAAVMLLLYAINHRVHVEMGEEADVTPFAQLPDLAVAVEPMPDDGPVLVQVEYLIDQEMRPVFLQAIQAVEATRRRNGASSWRVFRDLGVDGRFVERYIITSWAEYVRLRMRMTVGDRRLQRRVMEMQRKDVPLRISRLIAVGLADMNPAAADQAFNPHPGPAAVP